MSKMRKEFEAYMLKQGYSVDVALNCYPGKEYYYFPETRWFWEVWQASRGAICIEVPEIRVLDGGALAEIGYEMAINDFEKALKKAGVRYK